MRAGPVDIASIVCERSNEWSVCGIFDCSNSFQVGNQFWLKQKAVETYYCVYQTPKNYENSCVTVEKYFLSNSTHQIDQHPEVKNFVSLRSFIADNVVSKLQGSFAPMTASKLPARTQTFAVNQEQR